MGSNHRKQEKTDSNRYKEYLAEKDPSSILDILNSSYFDGASYGDEKYSVGLLLAMNYAKSPESKPSVIFDLMSKSFMQDSDRKIRLVRRFLLSHPGLPQKTRNILLDEAHGLDSETIRAAKEKKEASFFGEDD